jgi:hypothetical protein
MPICGSIFLCLILLGAPARGQSTRSIDPLESMAASGKSVAAEARIRPATDGTRRFTVVIADSSAVAAQHHTVLSALIGVVAGGILGGVVANQYAQAHRPSCLPTPAGFCQRDSDHSNAYRAIGIGVGAAGGWFVSVRLAR